MPPDFDLIISDTSCLILLNKIGELELLRKFGRAVLVTPAIASEFKETLPPWIEIASPSHNRYLEILQFELDEGEASAIALALEMDDSALLIDELKGRKVAGMLNLKYSGTFGLLLRAKQEGFISRVKPILEKVRATDFRFSEKLLEIVLEQAGES